MNKFFKGFLLTILTILILVFIIYLSGPTLDKPTTGGLTLSSEIPIEDVDYYIQKRNKIRGLKTGNGDSIIWADSNAIKSEYSIVYLHGFGASHAEGDPVHRHIADSLDANLYLARLRQHGLDYDSAFKGITTENYLISAINALSIGNSIGDKVVLMGTSTGASQALWLASKFPEQIETLILYSPYIQLSNSLNEKLVLGPWGEDLLELVMGGKINVEKRADSIAPYWSTYYHVDAYKALFNMIDATMTTETFSKVKQPVFLAYYFKNEAEQDKVVSVYEMKNMFKALSSNYKKEIAFPEVGNHVIASRLRSQNWKGVRDSTLSFLKEINIIKSDQNSSVN